MTKDLKKLLRTIRQQGFHIRYARSGHLRLTSPSGQTITVACTPKSPNAINRAKADLRRIGADL